MPYHNRLKRDNLSRIFEALWSFPGSSRAELARRLRLDRSTTGQLADGLIERGILEQHQDEESGPRGGRPPVRLHIKPGYGYAIGAEFTFPFIRLVAMDLAGEVLEYREIPVEETGPATIPLLLDQIDQLADHLESYKSIQGLLGVGIGASAVIEDGTVVRSDALKVNSPIAVPRVLRGGVPVTIMNDALACAVGEKHHYKESNLILALLELRPGDEATGIGVGVGLVIDGKLRHGRAITHILRPEHFTANWKSDRLIEEMGRGIALVANTAGVNQFVLAGDAEDCFDPLEESILRYARGPEVDGTPLAVGRTKHAQRSIAVGACYAAIDHLFRSHQFPIKQPE